MTVRVGGDDDAPQTAAPPADPDLPPARRVGPFEVERDGYMLTLRLPNQGGFGATGCLLFASTMFFILVLGVLSVIQTERDGGGPATPTHAFVPTENHFGFLWLFATVGMFVAVPLYVRRSYRASLNFSFDRATDGFYRNSTRLCALRKVESVRIRETKDPDDRYLYLLEVCHSDGCEVMLHNGYDEREVMNIANEIATFIHQPVIWK
jgi:hypothetical protein